MYIGIDLGTSSVKILLCDKYGNEIKSVTRDYPIYFPQYGYSEQNPYDWYEKTIDGLKEIVRGNESHIRGLSVAGQMHGLVMLDENDDVVRPAILWNDSRSSEECEYLNNTIGKEKLSEYTGNIAFPGFTAPKIMWVEKNENENFLKTRKIMLPKDYIIYRLTGKFVSEPSDASGLLLYDVKNGCYSKEMLDLCGITEDMLPEVTDSFAPCGKIKKTIAHELGLGEVIVAPGGGDNAMAAVGMGVAENEMCSISLGTSGTIFISADTFKLDKNNALHAFRHATGKFHLLGCMLSAASCNKWWIEDILDSESYSEFDSITVDGENKVYFLPYLMGERSPHNDPHLRGAFAGMSMDTSREDMAKAVMEGVCYGLRDSVEVARSEGIEIKEAYVTGGGSKSRVWCEMLANILKVRIVKCLNNGGPSLGAAMMAMVASGEYKSVQEAVTLVKVKEAIDFDPSVSEKYDKGYIKFKKLHESLKDWYRDE